MTNKSRFIVALCLSCAVLGSATQAQTEDCPVIESTAWIAWVNAMPGPQPPTLHISGQLMLPTPGYRIVVSTGPLDRKNPPTQRLFLAATPPDNPVLMALSTAEVSAQVPALSDRYGSVVIICGETAIAEINEVEVVQ